MDDVSNLYCIPWAYSTKFRPTSIHLYIMNTTNIFPIECGISHDITGYTTSRTYDVHRTSKELLNPLVYDTAI